jgi:hypothetical protein
MFVRCRDKGAIRPGPPVRGGDLYFSIYRIYPDKMVFLILFMLAYRYFKSIVYSRSDVQPCRLPARAGNDRLLDAVTRIHQIRFCRSADILKHGGMV